MMNQSKTLLNLNDILIRNCIYLSVKQTVEQTNSKEVFLNPETDFLNFSRGTSKYLFSIQQDSISTRSKYYLISAM